MPNLPVQQALPELKAVLAGSATAVLRAEPGSGKTTRVPLALLDEPWLAGRRILLLEPRRLAAVNAARYMASLLGEEVGRTVGYAIRFERKVSPVTRIEVITEGILARRLQADPELTGVGLVIFDEFHERSLHSDLGLALCRDAQQGLRPDLRLLVMSATLEVEPLARALGEPPLVAAGGRSHPVTVFYLERDPQGPVWEWTARGIRRVLRETTGDLLVFLPGAGEIRRTAELLSDLSTEVDLRPLFGDLPFAEQERAILPGPRRRVVLATNVAETSLTIEGIAAVVDSGLERRPRFDPTRGLTTLETVRISRASAEQRAGRAGRLGPGTCLRLWSEGTQGALLPSAPPEIRVADLAPLALELAAWGVEVEDLSWVDPPPGGRLAGGRALLVRLGALAPGGRLTRRGRAMAELPAYPRIARLLLTAREEGCGGLGCDLAAILAEGRGREGDLHRALEELASGRGAPNLQRAARWWRRRLGVEVGRDHPDPGRVARLLAVAFPDRIARLRNESAERYLLADGQGAALPSNSLLRGSPWLVVLDLAGRHGGESLIRTAFPVEEKDLEELFGEEIPWEREVGWEREGNRVVAREVRRLGELPLQERPAKVTDEEAVGAFLERIRREGLELFDWSSPARRFRARALFVARLGSEPGWPAFHDEALLGGVEEWLGPYLAGVRSLEQLKRLDLLPPLQARLGWERLAALERLAPERIEVPSGSRVLLDYEAGDGPVLGVKLQELFGLAETPRIAGGRVPVLIHLLSPARRPLAVTRDLASFWKSVYPEVRKEMKGRYPKHPWPDDPWSAEATGSAKKRG